MRQGFSGPKLGFVTTPGAHNNKAKRAFSAHLCSKGRSYGLQCPGKRDHCTHNAKIKESFVFLQ